MSWRPPCPAGRAEERMEAGGRQAASAGAGRRRRSKGGLMIAGRVPSCDKEVIHGGRKIAVNIISGDDG